MAHAVFARTDWLLGGAASTAAPAAARALPGLLGEARSQLVAETLDVLVQARAEQTFDAMDAGELPEPLWISEIAAGARLLLHHPNATAWQRAAALDVLGRITTRRATHGACMARAQHFIPLCPKCMNTCAGIWFVMAIPPTSRRPMQHFLKRLRLTRSPTVTWFAAFAQLQAADRLRDAQRTEESASTYRKSLETFEIATSLDRSLANTATYVSLAYCGLARLLLSDDDTIGAGGTTSRRPRVKSGEH